MQVKRKILKIIDKKINSRKQTLDAEYQKTNHRCYELMSEAKNEICLLKSLRKKIKNI